jgi:hypothetical protein
MNKKRFHFDFSHLKDNQAQLKFHIGEHQHTIQSHTKRTRTTAIRDNHALAKIPAPHHHRITHYADVPLKHLHANRLCRIKVTHDHGDARFRLPTLVHAAFYIPAQHRAEHRKKKFAKAAPGVHYKLLAYGVAATDAGTIRPSVGSEPKAVPVPKVGAFMQADASASPLTKAPVSADDSTSHDLAVADDADHFHTPLDAAAFILFHHPGLASSDPNTAAKVMDDHVNSPENNQALNDLAEVIATQHRDSDEIIAGWANIVQAQMPDGTPMTYENAFNCRLSVCLQGKNCLRRRTE